ncbi:baculoviral IAP repeat-containing protein 7 isoform X2 [Phyllostomus discolor]|uniref:RING-type E3 ubiquitin transferase n=1 Tax=Phyllostomus discolor TaxID=89673 RepID=A0A7E6CGI4_9CHIR|nr:baculoviral IAP repeat-containing protein 7 isoform X2 [Phyllostomus discolor]
MGPEGRAQCWCCGPERSCWAAGGSPTGGHCGPCSQCGHAQGQDPGGTLWAGQDHTDGQILGQLRALMEEEEEGAWAAPPSRPAFPEMGSEELRLASFCDWPLTATVRPELLAAAGFFHTGRQDKVRCFFCSGGLQTWERGDDPWTEHAKWFPRCGFLLRAKGRDFVSSVQASLRPPPGSWDPWEEPADAAPAASAPAHPTPRGDTCLADARESGRGGAAAAAAGGADLQGVPGPSREHRLRALRPPGLHRLRTQPAALPPLQGPRPQLRAHLPALGRGPRAAATCSASPTDPAAVGPPRTRAGVPHRPPGSCPTAQGGRGLVCVGLVSPESGRFERVTIKR